MRNLITPVLTGALVVAGLSLGSPTLASADALTPTTGSQLAELEGSGTQTCSWFGGDVGISGNTMVVGAYGYGAGVSCAGSFPGGALVFTKTAAGWKQTAVLTASDEAWDDWFGTAVAISGNTIVVGAPNKDSATGRVYVFTRIDHAWRQTAEFTGSGNGPNSGFGSSVGASGNTVVVSQTNQNTLANTTFVFSKTPQGWRQTAKLGNLFEKDMSGNTMVGMCGQFLEPDLCVLTNSPTGWQQTGEIFQNFSSAAISGSTIVVGDVYSNGSYSGQAYVFAKTSAGWVQTAELTGSEVDAKDYFGSSVAISGATIAVGAQGPIAGPPWTGSETGRVYLFAFDGAGWQQVAELQAFDSLGSDNFGTSIAMSGTTLAVGASGDDHGTGRGYVFQG